MPIPGNKIVLPFYWDCAFVVQNNPFLVIFRGILPLLEFAYTLLKASGNLEALVPF